MCSYRASAHSRRSSDVESDNQQQPLSLSRRTFGHWVAKGGIGLGLGGLGGCVTMPQSDPSESFLGGLAERLNPASSGARDQYRDVINTPEMKREAERIFQAASRRELGTDPLENVRKVIPAFTQTVNGLLQDIESEVVTDLGAALARLAPDLVTALREIQSLAEAQGQGVPSAVKARPARQISRNGSVFEMPPYTAFTYIQKGYCMDPSKPAPYKGDGLELWHVSQRIPRQLMPLFQALGDWAAQSPRNQAAAQRLTWAIMGAGNEGGWAATIDPGSLEMFNEIYPNGGKVFADYHNANVLAKRLLGKAIRKTGIERYTGRIDLNNPQATNAAANEVLQELVREGSRAVGNGVAGYTMIGEEVAAQSIGEASLTARVTIVNAASETRQVDLSEWYNQPTSNKQGISPTSLISEVRPVAVQGKTKTDPIDKLRELVWTFNQDLLKIRASKKLDALKNYSPAAVASVKKITGKTLDLLGIDRAASKLSAKVAMKSAAGVLPVVGNLLSFYEATTGKDWFSGEPLSPVERGLAVVGSIPGASQLRAIASGARSAGLLGQAARLSDKALFRLAGSGKFEAFKDVNDWLWSESVGQASALILPDRQNILNWNQEAKESKAWQSYILDLPLPWQNTAVKPIFEAYKGKCVFNADGVQKKPCFE